MKKVYVCAIWIIFGWVDLDHVLFCFQATGYCTRVCYTFVLFVNHRIGSFFWKKRKEVKHKNKQPHWVSIVKTIIYMLLLFFSSFNHFGCLNIWILKFYIFKQKQKAEKISFCSNKNVAFTREHSGKPFSPHDDKHRFSAFFHKFFLCLIYDFL